MYFGEIHMLMLRLYLLGPYVDFFVLGVSNLAHSKQSYSYNYSFDPYEFEIIPYLHKIHFCSSIFSGSESKDPWFYEKKQRQDMMAFIESTFNPQPDDLIIQTDLDEIPIPRALKRIIDHPPAKYYFLNCLFFIYSLRYLNHDPFYKITIFKYGTTELDINDYRYGPFDNFFPGYSCIHCSSCFNTPERYIKKVVNIAHQELNRPPYTEYEYLYARFKGQCAFLHDTVLTPFNAHLLFEPPPIHKLDYLFSLNPFPIPENISTNPKFIQYLNYCKQNRKKKIEINIKNVW